MVASDVVEFDSIAVEVVQNARAEFVAFAVVRLGHTVAAIIKITINFMRYYCTMDHFIRLSIRA